MDDKRITKRPWWEWMRDGGGFSLVELMIVVVIVGLLAAFAVPTLSSSMERNRLGQLNRDIGNAFLQSRSYAMRTGEAVFVEFGNNRIQFFEAGAATCSLAGNVAPDANNRLFDIEPARRGVEGVEIQTPDPDEAQICIAPNGRVLDTVGQPLASGDTSDCEEMNLLIPLYHPDGDGEFGYCEDDDTPQRELYDFSMIHVAYGGQVRVIR